MVRAVIRGTGLYVPGEPIDNRELRSLAGIEFDAERLEGHVGILRRHSARLRGLDESSADFAERAARAALEDASVDAGEVDLVLVATDTPEYISPATAVVVQGRLQGGERETTAFDVNASCASFVTALDVAARRIMTDVTLRHALVIGVYDMPAYVRPGDAFGHTIFADGAGAVVLSRVEGDDGAGFREGVFRADGTQWDFVGVYAGGTRRPVTHALLDAGTYGLELLQKLPGDRNVRLWPPLVRRLLEKAGLPQSQVAHYLFTQINRAVIHQVMGLLGEPLERTTTVMDRYGYTGSACLPMALHVARREGRVHPGDAVVLVGSGAGLSVGANLVVL